MSGLCLSHQPLYSSPPPQTTKKPEDKNSPSSTEKKNENKNNIVIVILLGIIVILLGIHVWIISNNKTLRKLNRTSTILTIFNELNNSDKSHSPTLKKFIEANKPQYANELNNFQEILNDPNKQLSTIADQVNEMNGKTQGTALKDSTSNSMPSYYATMQQITNQLENLEKLLNAQNNSKEADYKNILDIKSSINLISDKLKNREEVYVQKDNNKQSEEENKKLLGEERRKIQDLEEEKKKLQSELKELSDNKDRNEVANMDELKVLKEKIKNKEQTNNQLNKINQELTHQNNQLQKEIKSLKPSRFAPETESEQGIEIPPLVEEYNKNSTLETLEKYGKVVVQSLSLVNMGETRNKRTDLILEKSSLPSEIKFLVVKIDSCYLLFPELLQIKVKAHFYKLEELFHCNKYQEGKSKFHIVTPPRVSLHGSQQKWKLSEKGELNFE